MTALRLYAQYFVADCLAIFELSTFSFNGQQLLNICDWQPANNISEEKLRFSPADSLFLFHGLVVLFTFIASRPSPTDVPRDHKTGCKRDPAYRTTAFTENLSLKDQLHAGH